MDRMPAGNLDGFADNSHLFGDGQQQQQQQHQHQQYNAYETPSFLPTAGDSNHNFNAAWGINGNEFAGPHSSRGLQATPNYHVPTSFNNGQASPYPRNANQSPPQFNQTNFANYAGQQQQQQQQSFQYRRPPPQQQQYDPSLVAPSNGQTYNFFDAQHGTSGTIAPQALDRETAARTTYPYVGDGYQDLIQARSNRIPQQSQSRPVDQNALIATIPKGADAGMFGIITFDDLARATNSERMGNFANVGKEPYEWNISRSAIPAYVARMSRNEMRRQTGQNPRILAKIGKKSSRQKSSAALPKALKAFSATSSSGPQIKYEHDSSSSEDSSDDDSSAYSDDDESDSPLPSTRPVDSKGAVQYDTIKALWRSKRKDLEGEIIRKSLVDFWEVIKTIRDRWKVDTAAVAEAEEKKRVGELPLLKSRVKDQRDMIEVAFRTALKHGHRDIVSLLSENTSLMFVCYQVLLDRFKADDVNAGISKTVLETMSLFTTLNNTKLEKVNLDKVLPRVQKKGDARVQFWVKKILQNAEAATKDAAAQAAQKASASIAVKPESPSGKRAAPEPVAGVKRSAATPGDGGLAKKLATGASKTNGTTASAKVQGASVKTANESVKPAAAATGPVATRKTVVAKPSGFFSGLQSATKKPGTSNADRSAAASAAAKPALTSRLAGKPAATAAAPNRPAFSFAETMANLAKPKEEKTVPKPQKEEKSENPEDRAKRLRKEQRRKLHVRFKEREELVEIRYFTHDPDEESGHDASQMRDVSDVGGEGRVLKQHKAMEDLDDEDEIMEDADTLLEYSPPSLVDFSVVDEDERKRNYAPYGGGEAQPDSAERAKREAYENSTLLVFYANPSEIPPNPREPADPYTGDAMTLQHFGEIEQKYANRAIQKRLQRLSRNQHPGQLNNTSFMIPQQPPAQSTAPPTAAPDISAILASLKAVGPYSQPPQQPAPTYQYQTPPVSAAPAANIDLAAILANLAPQAQQQANYSANGPPANFGQQSQPQQNSFGGNGRGSDKSKNYKTQPCKFWPIGKCVKGDKCSYLHE